MIKEESPTQTIIYLYDANGSPVGFKYRSIGYAEDVWDEYFYEKNLQGDVIAVYDSSGVKLYSYDYTAWGKFARTQVLSAATTALINPYLYRGYYYDYDLGLYYLESRYYDPVTCRFINADDYLGANQDILSYNLYAYCSNNPIKYVDPSGHSIILIALAVGLVAGFVGTSIADVADDGKIFNGSIDAITYIANSSVCAAVAVAGATFTPFITYTPVMVTTTEIVAVAATSTTAIAMSIGVVLFAKQSKKSNKERSTEHPSWTNRSMIDPNKSAQDNAQDMLDNKYGKGTWKKGQKSEYNQIVKWIIRSIFNAR